MQVVHKSNLYLAFRCPGCNTVHRIDSTWAWNGDSEKPTVSPSILILGGLDGTKHICHSIIHSGRIHFLDDCEHMLAGQVVDLPEYVSDLPD